MFLLEAYSTDREKRLRFISSASLFFLKRQNSTTSTTLVTWNKLLPVSHDVSLKTRLKRFELA